MTQIIGQKEHVSRCEGEFGFAKAAWSKGLQAIMVMDRQFLDDADDIQNRNALSA